MDILGGSRWRASGGEEEKHCGRRGVEHDRV